MTWLLVMTWPTDETANPVPEDAEITLSGADLLAGEGFGDFWPGEIVVAGCPGHGAAFQVRRGCFEKFYGPGWRPCGTSGRLPRCLWNAPALAVHPAEVALRTDMALLGEWPPVPQRR